MVGRFKQFYYYYFVRSLFAPNSGFSEPDNDVKQPTARSGSFLSVLILTLWLIHSQLLRLIYYDSHSQS